MDTPLDLTGRYKEKTIHKFLKDDILDIIRSQNAIFQPFFDPETYPDLELIIVMQRYFSTNFISKDSFYTKSDVKCRREISFCN